MFLLSLFMVSVSGQNQTFTTSGTFTVPAGVSSIIVECWGGGGAGGGTTANNSRGGGGGAGGAYARKIISVTPGDPYTVTVGGVRTGTTGAGAAGNPSWFGTVGTVYAEGGAGGAAPNGGTVAGGIGSSANSIGDIVFAGGNGANGTAALSGGGGGGAGSTGTGGSASGMTAGTGTTVNGGNGGAGRNNEGNGRAGLNYGGGGSGAYLPDASNHTGGSGAQGLVIVSWSVGATYNSSTTFTVPAGVSSITVECWGAGGAGGGNTTNADGGGGGGGGAYSSSILTVVPGDTYTVTVGTGGTGSTGAGNPGGDTWFGSSATILAKGGTGGASPVSGAGGLGGTGGTAASSIGTIKYNGGNGGRGRDNNTGQGGPGGSSAGTGADGTSGSDPFSTITAAAAPAGGGKGGNGGAAGSNGSAGSVPGGGGGGSGDVNRSGGTGANGQVRISYAYPTFYSQGSVDPSVPGNWKTLEGHSPANFTTANQTFIIQSGDNMPVPSGGWTVSGASTIVEIRSGAVLTENFLATFSAGTTLIINDGGTLNHNVNSIYIFGGGESFANASTVNYGYAGVQTVVNAIYGNLTLSGSGIKTISTSTVEGIISMEGTATASAAPAYGTDATLQYKGSAPQTTGDEFPATFSSAGGVVIDNINGVILNSSRTIDNLLSFVNGRLSTGANTIIIGIAGDITGAGAGKYVYGNLRLDINTAAPSVIFEIGDATNYTPVEILFSGATNATGNIVANTTTGDHPNIGTSAINSLYSVNRYWTITNNGVTGYTSYDATFAFVPGDLDAGTDFNSFLVGRYNLAAWSYPALGAKSSTSTQATGMTAFGDFQIGHMVSDFRSSGSGNWDQPTVWEVFAGGSWIPAPVTPTSAGGTITIQNASTITIAAPVTIDQVTVNSGGTLTLGSNAVLSDGTGTDMTILGTINCSGSNALTGAGSFLLSSAATIFIGSPDGITTSGATGNIQTATRTFDPGANYYYNGSAAQVTGNGLPATVNDLVINNGSGVSLSSSITISGALCLTAGAFSAGSGAITFLSSNTPLTRTSGTITTTSATDIAFGTAGFTGGAAFTIPSGIFTSPPVINNLSVYRINGITLNDQLISVVGVVKCNGPFNTNNNLVLLSTATQTALVDGTGTAQITGNVTMQRYLPSGFGYRYISSPFQAATVSQLSPEVNLASGFPLVYRYDENRTSSGWVSYVNPLLTLNPLQGYSANFGSVAAPEILDITGVVSNGAYSVTLYNHDYTYTKGMNLVGNPYPSPIDWNAAAGWTKTNIDAAVYYFKPGGTDQYGGTYASFVPPNISSDGIVSNIIPSMQGFFVHVTNGSYPVTGTLAMDNQVRVNNFSQTFSKSEVKSGPSELRLTISFETDTIIKDALLFYADDMLTGLFDNKSDALKLFNTDLSVPNIYSTGTDGNKLSINGLPYLTGTALQLPLGIKANINGTIVIKLKTLTGSFAGNDIFFTDAVAGSDTRLNGGVEYRIYLPKAEYLNRFYLNINNITTGISEPERQDRMFAAWISGSAVNVEINELQGGGGTIIITNILGQRLTERKVFECGHYEFSLPSIDGIYFITLVSDSRSLVRKLVFNR